jgi:hypothetical protein
MGGGGRGHGEGSGGGQQQQGARAPRRGGAVFVPGARAAGEKSGEFHGINPFASMPAS